MSHNVSHNDAVLKERGTEKHEDLPIDQTRTSFVAEHVQQKCPVAEQLSVSQILQNLKFSSYLDFFTQIMYR